MGGGTCYHPMCRECRDHYPACPECGHKLVPEHPLDKSLYLDSVLAAHVVENNLTTKEEVMEAVRKEWGKGENVPDTAMFKLLLEDGGKFVAKCKELHQQRSAELDRAESAVKLLLGSGGAAAAASDRPEKRARTEEAGGPALLFLAANKTSAIVGSTSIRVAAFSSGCKKCRLKPTIGVNSVCKTPSGWVCFKCAFGVPETVENIKKILSAEPFQAPKRGATPRPATIERKKVAVPKGLELEF